MNLREYLESERITVKDFAKNIGFTRQRFHRILAGQDFLLTDAYIIEKATRGKVKVKDLYQFIVEKESKKNKLPHSKK